MTEVDTIMRDGVVSVPASASSTTPGQKNKHDDPAPPPASAVLLGATDPQQQQQQNGMKAPAAGEPGGEVAGAADDDDHKATDETSTTTTTTTTLKGAPETDKAAPASPPPPPASDKAAAENGEAAAAAEAGEKPPSVTAITSTSGGGEAKASRSESPTVGNGDAADSKAGDQLAEPAGSSQDKQPAAADKPPDKVAGEPMDTDEPAGKADEAAAPEVTPMECDEAESAAVPVAAAAQEPAAPSSSGEADSTTDASATPASSSKGGNEKGDSNEASLKADGAETKQNGGGGGTPLARPPPQIEHIDSNIVNLDDDSDVEMDVPSRSAPPAPNTGGGGDSSRDPLAVPAAAVQPTPVEVAPKTSAAAAALPPPPQPRLSNDSDGAVVIGSDSETETTVVPLRKPASAPVAPLPSAPLAAPIVAAAPPPPPIDDDDDDDDCVVIEDETTAPPANLHGGLNDLAKRKSLAMDGGLGGGGLDGEQPPSKRARGAVSLTAVGGGAMNQLSIKDARSLLPQQQQQLDGGKMKVDPSIYPMNLSAASAGGLVVGGGANQAGPPKLVPVSATSMQTAAVAAAAGLPMGGLGTANANLLPGLTDDMFVLEAPSFIVPYIYEKPPSEVLKDVVKEIEAKYGLSKEDLADADKSDEFDMMTEQNKEDKDEKEAAAAAAAAAAAKKKSRKRRGGDDPDESWSEDSDDDDDDDEDDDSESGVRTKVLIKEASDDLTAAYKAAIKPAAAVVQSAAPAAGGAGNFAKPGQENYFESPLGKFFMDIGVGQVQEFVQSDLIRLQKRKMRKSLGKNITEFERAIAALSGNLEASKKKNAPFKFTLKRCEFCNFKSESALAMANHYETPHMNGPLYKCNFCTFEIRNATEIVYHMEAMHNIKARLIKPLPYHQCPNCGFEDNGKAKLARHQPVCAKKFRPELNLAPPNDWEAPAKIPRIKPRHGLVGTATAYQAMAAQAAAHKAALATLQQQQQQQQQQVVMARNMQAVALAQQTAAVNKVRGRPPQMAKQPGQMAPIPTTVPRGASQVRTPINANNAMLTNNYQVSGGQLIPAGNMSSKKTIPGGQPSISITPLPRQSVPSPQQPAAAGSGAGGASSSSGGVSAASSSKMPPAGMKPGQSPNAAGKAQFVICEICDGYIKDLEQLRNHMQWMHKVKIHPKMIYNRPPLNCQKCQFRFFTDQGLERHLLGSHGLVTSSMQEAANKGKDAGRCPVCGRMYQWKLLNHVSRDHHMTLKPAHLSYKCTVCTATFGMYKQFETHVYTAHSTVAKKAIDGKSKSNNSSPSTASAVSGGSGGAIGAGSTATTSQRLNLSATNDSLLKPLKINDEITIIPQPSSKPRIMNMESHVID